MIRTDDFKTDESDDIMIHGDFQLEGDYVISILKTAERRVSARFDDFLLRNAGAGIEEFLYKRINSISKELIKGRIASVLGMDNLLLVTEYKTFILDSDTQGKQPILIRFNLPGSKSNYSFKALINQHNQRSYN